MESRDLVESIREANARYGLFAPGQAAVVGVSGGPDSTALLHALASLREEWQLTLFAAHLEHGFRGAESEADAAYVVELCERLGVPCQVRCCDVPAARLRRHVSAQEAARSVRHAFLKEVAAEVGAVRIALGHTRDDRIETALLNFLRGTGIDGLAAMPALRAPLVRPLIHVSRAETTAYCLHHALQPRHDSSNDHKDYRRNRMRAELLPYLTSYYNERVGDAILRIAELATEDSAYLEECAEEALSALAVSQTATEIVLPAAGLEDLPLALRRRVARRAVARVRGGLENISFEAIDALLQALARRQPLERELPAAGEIRVRLQYDGAFVRIAAVSPPKTPAPWRILLTIPGRTPLERCGLVAEASIFENGAALEASLASVEAAERARILVFRAVQVQLPILARSWRPGDRLRLRHLGGSKKLQDLFTDEKTPVEERGKIPVLVEEGGAGRLLAAVGLRADETALSLLEQERLQDSDPGEKLLLIRFSPLGN